MNLGRVVLKNLGRVVLGRVLCGPSWHGPSWFWAELSVIRTKYRKVYGGGGGGGVFRDFRKSQYLYPDEREKPVYDLTGKRVQPVLFASVCSERR